MKKLILLVIGIITISCQTNPDLSLYQANKKVAEKFLLTYQSPTNFDLFKSMIAENIVHQSPMYGAGEVGYDEAVGQAEFYMTGFENVKFTKAIWLPGVDEETLLADGSVRVYGTWSGNSIASGKEFSVDAYHYFMVKDGKISKSGDYFDATGMIMAIQPDPVVE